MNNIPYPETDWVRNNLSDKQRAELFEYYHCKICGKYVIDYPWFPDEDTREYNKQLCEDCVRARYIVDRLKGILRERR